MFSDKKILLADDHSVVRRGTGLILKEIFIHTEIIHADSFDAVLSVLTNQQIDLLILDINLPGGNTPAMVKKAKMIQPSLGILIFSAFDEEQYALRYLNSGADGYLNKLTSEDKIMTAATSILQGERYISEKIKEKMLENIYGRTPENPLEKLSNRELEIVTLYAQGEGNLEIANKLNIQTSTVSTYKNRIFDKLGVNNIVSLVEQYKIYS
ncbi:response regulator transcription factor [Flavobacterium salilacus subsp. salilacus]|uniref:response regulator n=1 Tax=Flavobacterium TaxID=237 RepID=UPI00107541A9|nr:MULTISPECIES: response regulator transcription factor [Flavobacterium]KAF2515450.1 response regulator transcription factor [Flavobacterium salilacus subsp. salilacus]MBE1615847.1 response regulator transcription factor [Flavobacterium sp. SaA2.13]